nr:MAG TPA: hypothetical protein [Caudoviricetes sp.]
MLAIISLFLRFYEYGSQCFVFFTLHIYYIIL